MVSPNQYIWHQNQRCHSAPFRSSADPRKPRMRKHLGILTGLGLTVLLTACGGGTASDANNLAEGARTGTDSWGNSFVMLVLENGDFYSLYGTNKAGDFVLQGFDQGTPTVNGSALQGAITEYDSSNPAAKGKLDATLVSGSALKGTIANAAGTAAGTFTATPLSAKYANFDYHTSAKPSDVAYSWTVTTLNGSAEKISISATGAVAGSINGCSLSGTVSPRGKGKNVLNMDLLFGPSPCANAKQSVSGIALDYDLGNGKRQLLAALQDPKKSYGYSFSAQR